MAAVAVAAVAGVALAGAGNPGHATGGRLFPSLHAGPAPLGWHSVTLPDGAVLSFPPSMQPVRSDKGAASAAAFSPSGDYLLYLNATPHEGKETLRNWPAYRISHLLDDDARSARQLSAASGVRFLGGSGSCVLDTYVTKVGAHHYTELACLVQGSHASSVVIGAAPASGWARAAALLDKAVAAYRVS
jgi:hypothetical protein